MSDKLKEVDKGFTLTSPATSSVDLLSNPAVDQILNPQKSTSQAPTARIDAAQTVHETTKAPSKKSTKKKQVKPKNKTVTVSASIPEELANRLDAVIEKMDASSIGKVNRNILLTKIISEAVTKHEKKQ